MPNYEKRVEQEAAYPIPISLYNCYRTVRHEKRYQEYNYSYASLLMPHCPVPVVQRYRDGVCSLLFHSSFIICHPYIPLHLEEILVILLFGCANAPFTIISSPRLLTFRLRSASFGVYLTRCSRAKMLFSVGSKVIRNTLCARRRLSRSACGYIHGQDV